MRKIVLFLLFFSSIAQAQELNCTVKVNALSLGNGNQTVFKTLEKSLTEFLNKTKWTTQNFKLKERIDCSMFINVTSFAADQFTATIQIESSRPIFNSTYTSPIFNYNDKDFSFKYVEYEALIFNPNSFDSNLIAVVSYYANMIIGLDGDTFSMMGGADAYAAAQQIVSTAQGSNYKGWSQSEGNQNRYFLVNELVSNNLTPIRETLFDYHSKGLDKMSEDLKASKEQIKSALMNVEKVNLVRPNNIVTRMFFDGKSDEIVSVFSGGPKIDIADLLDKLARISPLNASKWASIKF
jgi:Domain of unknown function (DUF4835)